MVILAGNKGRRRPASSECANTLLRGDARRERAQDPRGLRPSGNTAPQTEPAGEGLQGEAVVSDSYHQVQRAPESHTQGPVPHARGSDCSAGRRLLTETLGHNLADAMPALLAARPHVAQAYHAGKGCSEAEPHSSTSTQRWQPVRFHGHAAQEYLVALRARFEHGELATASANLRIAEVPQD